MQKALNGKSSIRERCREEMPPAESISDGNYVKCVRELISGNPYPGNSRYLLFKVELYVTVQLEWNRGQTVSI